MDTKLVKNAVVLTPSGTWEQGWLLSQGKHIARMGQGAAPNFEDIPDIDAGGLILAPGFIDLHVHGAMGYEAMDATPEALAGMAQYYAQHGTTAFLAATWTDTRERILAALRAVGEALGPQVNGATLLGVYLEGPYLNTSKCGAQNTDFIRRADPDEALEFLAQDVIREVVIAPEFEENHWLIEECVRRGIAVSAGHTSATYDQMKRAVELGVTQTTHTFNAMTGLHHREPGTLGAALSLPEIMCELIADNIHVHPAAMELLANAKGPDSTALITDAVRGTGLPDGEYPIDENRFIIMKEGAARLPDGTLAGSTLTMNRAVYNFMQAVGKPLDQVWKTASLNPARAIHMHDRKGSLEVGKDADFVLIDDDLNVYLTVAEGQIVYQR
jgi:N-acetylglucosamine-6-phosphate deacetylase